MTTTEDTSTNLAAMNAVERSIWARGSMVADRMLLDARVGTDDLETDAEAGARLAILARDLVVALGESEREYRKALARVATHHQQAVATIEDGYLEVSAVDGLQDDMTALVAQRAVMRWLRAQGQGALRLYRQARIEGTLS